MGKSEKLWFSFLASKSPNTKRLYQRYMIRFLKQHGLDYETLYQVKQDSLKSEDARDSMILENMVSQSILADGTKSADKYQMVIAQFLKVNGLLLNKQFVNKPSKQTSIGKDLVTKEEIKVILDYPKSTTPQRFRAMLLFLKDSGLSISDICALNIAHYQEAQFYTEKEEKYCAFKPIHRIKTGVLGYPHIGSESINALEDYLKTRETVAKNDPLFIIRDGNRIKPYNLRRQLRTAINNIPQITRNISLHSFRKYHQTYLERAMLKNYIAKLQCKQINDSTSPYSNPQQLPYSDNNNLTRTYIECYDSLRIETTLTDLIQIKHTTESQQERINQLEIENASYKTHADSLQSQVVDMFDYVQAILKLNDLESIIVPQLSDSDNIKTSGIPFNNKDKKNDPS